MKTINDYAELVKEEHALNKTLAPVEDDLTGASQPYAKGAKFIYNGIMYQAKTAIAQGAALVLNTNYEAAPDVETQIANEAAARSQMGAKNLLPFDLDAIKDLNTAGTWAGNVYTYRGVDFTVNPDGTILADGQATGGNASIKVFAATSSYEMLGKNVILNGCPSGGSATTYRIQAYRMGSADGATGTYFDDGDGTIAFDALNNASGTVGSFAVAVYENYDADNLLFKPMVRLATDSNDTYQPYAKTNKELTDDVSSLNSAIANEVETRAKLGAHNLIPNNAVSTTNNDVTYTVNADGSVTANGTASGNSVFQFLASDEFFEKNFVDGEKYILSGCPSGGGDSTYCIQTFRTPTAFDYGDGVEFTYHSAGTGKLVQIVVFDGVTVSNLTFYPMIRLATDANADYQPYAMTNQQITPYMQAISNPNLLDNPWFTVDQRGLAGTSWTDNAGVIRLDRWVIDSGDTGSFINGVVTHTKPLYQTVEAERVAPLLGKTLTLSAMKADGSIVSTTFTLPTTLPASGNVFYGDGPLYFVLFANGTAQLARIHNNTVNPKAVKLEIGAVSTLAMDTAPNYQQELAKCQRYFVRFNSPEAGSNLSVGYQHLTNQILVIQTMPVSMRAKPTITVTALRTAVEDTTYAIPIDTIVAANMMENILKITITTSSNLTTPAGSTHWVYLSANNYMDLSAEL